MNFLGNLEKTAKLSQNKILLYLPYQENRASSSGSVFLA